MSEDDTFKKAILREGFLSLSSPRDVASLLGISYSQLVYHVYKTHKDRRYKILAIPKKGGGTREISAPATPLKLIQQSLNAILGSVYSPKRPVHGFVQNRSIVTNAQFHVGSKWILTIDIEDFFPSINFGRIRGLFIKPPYSRPPSVATVLAQICTHNNSLPQGAPSSPVVSNMICARLDRELQFLAKSLGCRYSRYADDITFSTNRSRFPTGLAETITADAGIKIDVGEPLRKIIESNGFRINTKKVRLQRFSQRQIVTGLTANDFPNVGRKFMRQVRAALHNCAAKGIELAEKDFHSKYLSKHRKPGRPLPSLMRVLKGRIDFIGMVRGKKDFAYANFLKKLGLIDPSLVKEVPPTDYREYIQRSLWVIESEDSAAGLLEQGTGFMLQGYGLVTCAHVVGYPKIYAYRASEPSRHYAATIAVQNKDIDLAILKIDSPAPDALERETIRTPRGEEDLILAGYPNFAPGHTGIIDRCRIIGSHAHYSPKRLFINRAVIYGNSGGPLLNMDFRVVGIAVTGAASEGEAEKTERHGIIPISALDLIESAKESDRARM